MVKKKDQGKTDPVGRGGTAPVGVVGGGVASTPDVEEEGVEVADVEHGDHLGFGPRHVGPVALRLEGRHHQSLSKKQNK